MGPPAPPKPHAHAADPAGTSGEERVPGPTGRRIRAEGPNHPGWWPGESLLPICKKGVTMAMSLGGSEPVAWVG